MCSTVYPAVTKTLTTNRTTPFFYPTTQWLPAISCYKAKSVVTLMNPTTDFRCASAYMTATTNPNTPDGATQLGSTVLAEGTVGDTWVDVHTALSTKFWVRFGILIWDANATQGNVLKKGEVTCSVATKSHA